MAQWALVVLPCNKRNLMESSAGFTCAQHGISLLHGQVEVHTPEKPLEIEASKGWH